MWYSYKKINRLNSKRVRKNICKAKLMSAILQILIQRESPFPSFSISWSISSCVFAFLLYPSFFYLRSLIRKFFSSSNYYFAFFYYNKTKFLLNLFKYWRQKNTNNQPEMCKITIIPAFSKKFELLFINKNLVAGWSKSFFSLLEDYSFIKAP